MSQLIALIIAIALGAIVTAIGYVFLGDAFTKNSERGVAFEYVNQASQVEMAMTAYRAENAKTGFDTNWDTTQTDSTNNDGLVDLGYLKDGLTPAIAGSAFSLVANSGDVYLVATNISSAVCAQIQKLQNGGAAVNTAYTNDPLTGAHAATALNGKRYGCFVDDVSTVTNATFVYEVE